VAFSLHRPDRKSAWGKLLRLGGELNCLQTPTSPDGPKKGERNQWNWSEGGSLIPKGLINPLKEREEKKESTLVRRIRKQSVLRKESSQTS